MDRRIRLAAGAAFAVLVLAVAVFTAFNLSLVGSWFNQLGHWTVRHPGDATVTGGYFLIAGLLGQFSHTRGIDRGRWGLWFFLMVVWAGFWFIFWIAPPISDPSRNALNLTLTPDQVVGFAFLGMFINAIVHWSGELRERTRKEIEEDYLTRRGREDD